MAAIARRILAAAPPRFALAGLSMGGYIAFEIMRQAPGASRNWRCSIPGRGRTRRSRPSAQRPDGDGRGRPLSRKSRNSHFRSTCIATGTATRRSSASCAAWPKTPALEAYVRQQQAIMSRPDSRPGLAAIACPTLVLVGEGDEATPPELAREIAAGIPGSRLVIDSRKRPSVDARTAGGGDQGAGRMAAAIGSDHEGRARRSWIVLTRAPTVCIPTCPRRGKDT